MILWDTSVLIDFYKGQPVVTKALQAIGVPDLAISVVTAGELYFGAKDKRELLKIKKHLALLRQLPLDTEISDNFLSLIEAYALSHKLGIPDAIIASTALRHNLPLYTLNVKDFRYIPGLALHTP